MPTIENQVFGDPEGASTPVGLTITEANTIVQDCVFYNCYVACQSDFQNTVFRRNRVFGQAFYDNLHFGVSIRANGGVIEDNYFEDVGNSIVTGLSSRNHQIRRNRVINPWDNGIYISSGYDCIVEYNEVIGNKNPSVGNGIKVRGSGHIIRHNTVAKYGNGIGIVATGIVGGSPITGENNLLEYNKIFGRNCENGIRCDDVTNTIIRYNWMDTIRTPIRLEEAGTVEQYGNTFAGRAASTVAVAAPTAQIAAANSYLEGLGYGPNTFSVAVTGGQASLWRASSEELAILNAIQSTYSLTIISDVADPATAFQQLQDALDVP